MHYWGKDVEKYNPKAPKTFDKIPYIIRRYDSRCGLFSYFNTILNGIAYADQHGMIPVVDMKNYPNTYLFDDEVGHVNYWEYYFEQPGGISLEDALSCKRYILGKDTALIKVIPGENLDYARMLVKKYIHPKQEVLDRLDELIQRYSSHKRILGVHMRGTDMTALKMKNHCIQPTAQQMIAKAREVMKDKNFDALFLATEDKYIVAEFQEAFGDDLLLPDVVYPDYDYESGDVIDCFQAIRENYKYLSGMEYLVSVLFLSKCKGFIASGSNSTIGALRFSDGFEYYYYFDLGLYK